MNAISASIKARAVELGFNLVGVTRAEPSPQLDAYFRWIDAGMHGSMSYMARADRQARRRDLNLILPGVRSLIVVGLDYRAYVPDELLRDPARGRIASYAWGIDYHDLITPRLETLAREIGGSARVYVDTGAILERSHAHQAGLGFIGKNTMLIHPRRGSFFFLGEILTDLEADTYDAPGRTTMCGSCTRCLNACPTDAFPQPHVLDARRCISYWTIEHKGWIDRDLRSRLGNWVYGCDVCQEVCPFQRFVPETNERAFHPADMARVAPRLLDLLALDVDAFNRQFGASPIQRIGRDRLVRNACIAAGNWGSDQAVPSLERLLADPNPLVRGHAVWALGKVNLSEPALRLRYDHEQDSEVRAEIAAALGE
ncbi:MAG TPA: tRNA epoxyqueuosine(34) reductase QueG [Phototrophicaceae bacterium]|nr:tRNA epoxyqueuosine(34) reductase QueG [Phototrophicaceae bacterium]